MDVDAGVGEAAMSFFLCVKKACTTLNLKKKYRV